MITRADKWPEVPAKQTDPHPATGNAGTPTTVPLRLRPRFRGHDMLALLQATPLAAILAVFLLVPIATLIVVSFFDYDSVQIIPGFVLTNYRDVLLSATTWWTYLETLKFTAIVWALTLLIGFSLAYFLSFVVQSRTWQTTWFLVCTVPFLTSNIIRMISWVPFLGRNGLLNGTLLRLGLIRAPLEFLLFSDFAVVLAFVHLYTLFMVAPIFNSMVRIDRRLIEAATDAGARPWRVIVEVIIPLAKPGIAIGSIFVVTLVMGDFITVRLMSGGQSASVGLMISNEVSLLQYPAAAANAVVLLAVVLLMVSAIVRLIDLRKEL
jgi:putative spermidine/putrescine transport system permease protein